MKSFIAVRTICVLAVFCLANAIALAAQDFTTLLSFDGTNGSSPIGSLLQGANGNFYGTASGSIVEITPWGQVRTLYTFCAQPLCTDGAGPVTTLFQSTDGNLYGTTQEGGTSALGNDSYCKLYGCGTVFRLTPSGGLTSLYSFCSQPNCADGMYPSSGLVQGVDGSLYGTTSEGGANRAANGQYNAGGTIFKITPGGQLTTIYNFCSQVQSWMCLDGEAPEGLVQAANGRFYGVTSTGGTNGYGSFYEVTRAGNQKVLYSFAATGSIQQFPNAIILGVDGNFYGTTYAGGARHSGSVFRLTPTGGFKTLYSFCTVDRACSDGYAPVSPPVQGTDGNLYGTTRQGGTFNDAGTFYQLTLQGKLTSLYNFCSQASCADGTSPWAAPLQATNGRFYGNTLAGGSSNLGTVFSLSVGLGPFVEGSPGFARVGGTVNILGNNLTGTTSVSFNGTAAAFTIVSASRIKATVPAGATTGIIQVTTPARTLSSNVAFQVMP